MPAGNAYPSEQLSPSLFGTCLWSNYPEFVSFSDFSSWMSFCTFSILLYVLQAHYNSIHTDVELCHMLLQELWNIRYKLKFGFPDFSQTCIPRIRCKPTDTRSTKEYRWLSTSLLDRGVRGSNPGRVRDWVSTNFKSRYDKYCRRDVNYLKQHNLQLPDQVRLLLWSTYFCENLERQSMTHMHYRTKVSGLFSEMI